MASYKRHARKVKLSKELQSLNEFFKDVNGEIYNAIIRSLDKSKDECTKEFTDTLVKMLYEYQYEWINLVWVVGEEFPRRLGLGHIDLILNPNLDNEGEETELGMGPFGILISAKENGNLFGAASDIKFTIFISVSISNSFYIAEEDRLYLYEYQEQKKDLFFRDEIKKIPPGVQIRVGNFHPIVYLKAITEPNLKQKCALLFNSAMIDNGLVSNLNNFLRTGGALIYADYPGVESRGSRLLVGELEPIAHLVSCACAETRVAGGKNLITFQPTDQNQRVTSFVYTNNLKDQLYELAYLWPLCDHQDWHKG